MESHVAEAVVTSASAIGVVVDHWPPKGAPLGGDGPTLPLWEGQEVMLESIGVGYDHSRMDSFRRHV